MSNILNRIEGEELSGRRRRKGGEEFIGGEVMERSHRDVVRPCLVCRELGTKILKREEAVGIVKALLILPVAALHLAIVTRGIGSDELVSDAQLVGGLLKEGGVVSF